MYQTVFIRFYKYIKTLKASVKIYDKNTIIKKKLQVAEINSNKTNKLITFLKVLRFFDFDFYRLLCFLLPIKIEAKKEFV